MFVLEMRLNTDKFQSTCEMIEFYDCLCINVFDEYLD
jgi:hypothetical protein